jgi:hypothetical protein
MPSPERPAQVAANPVAANPVAANPVAANPVAANPVQPARLVNRPTRRVVPAHLPEDEPEREPRGAEALVSC